MSVTKMPTPQTGVGDDFVIGLLLVAAGLLLTFVVTFRRRFVS